MVSRKKLKNVYTKLRINIYICNQNSNLNICLHWTQWNDDQLFVLILLNGY